MDYEGGSATLWEGWETSMGGVVLILSYSLLLPKDSRGCQLFPWMKRADFLLDCEDF